VALKFLIDECSTLLLVGLANERGFEAYYVPHRGLGGAKDHELVPVLLEDDLILVTNNGPDFTALLSSPDTVHPGLIVLVTQVAPAVQVELFRAVLDHLDGREELVNTVIEVDVDEATRAALQPMDRWRTKEEWNHVADAVKPVVREYPLPPPRLSTTSPRSPAGRPRARASRTTRTGRCAPGRRTGCSAP
jgi:hypothetical protein